MSEVVKTSSTQPTCIVLGLGGIGSAAAAHLALRGVRVLGLDAYEPGHAHGSSHGRHRIIREAYFEAPEYVPFVQRAYDLWRDLEARSGSDLLTITGGLTIGMPDSLFVSGALQAVREHGLPHELLSANETNARFPGFRPANDMVSVYEPSAGFLAPEACGTAHLDVARGAGADLHFGETVLAWEETAAGVSVTTTHGAYTADRMVIAAGPWSGEVLAGLDLPLSVWRIPNAHFDSTAPERFTSPTSPVFLLSAPEGEFYGFPWLPEAGIGVKIGRHDTGDICTPDTIRRDVSTVEVDELRRALDAYLPGASGPLLKTLTCMYTMTPDGHFIVDRTSDRGHVTYFAGCSGHAYKFASALGEALACMACDAPTPTDLAFLSAARFTTGDGPAPWRH